MATPHLETLIQFFPSNSGGLKNPIKSGYRGQIFYNWENWDAIHNFPGVDQVSPGDTVKAETTLLSPAQHKGRIAVDMKFEIREGTRSVAKGKVVKINHL